MPGYSGNDCSIDIDDCQANNCINGATCSVSHLTHKLDHAHLGITSLFVIQHVQSQRSYYVQDKHNTTDTSKIFIFLIHQDLVGGYNCICAAGFNGRYCEHDINECLEGPCQNGGTCNDLINQFTCDCPAPYTVQHATLVACHVSTSPELLPMMPNTSHEAVEYCNDDVTCNLIPSIITLTLCRDLYVILT